MGPKFSIVVPTRRPSQTLRHTLRTLVAQDFDDFEVIVSDNTQSSVPTAVVSELNDSRIRLVETPGPLAMVDSWNFAFAHAKGEYATLLGDDDGLLLHAMPVIDAMVSRLSPQLIQWNSVTYWWPDVPRTYAGNPNELVIPLEATKHVHKIDIVNARAWIRSAVSFQSAGMNWPNIRCAFVHRSLLDELQKRTGTLFQAEAPDVYSAFALAALIEEFPRLDAPMEIFGFSGGSTNVGVLFLKGRSATAEDFENLNAESTVARHPHAARIPVGAALLADAFSRAKDALFPDDDDLVLDRKLIATRSIVESRPNCDQEWQEILKCVRESLRDRPRLAKWFDVEWSNVPLDEHLEKNVLARDRGYYAGQPFSLDAAQFGVTDIFEAAELVEKLFRYRATGFKWQLAHETRIAAESGWRARLRPRWHGFLTMTGLMDPYVRLRSRFREPEGPVQFDPQQPN